MKILIVKTPFCFSDERVSCVYRVRFSNGFFYIGATADLENRCIAHAHNLSNGYFGDIGSNVFEKEKCTIIVDVLEMVNGRTKLFEREKYYIQYYSTNKRLLNRNKVSSNGKIYRTLRKTTRSTR